jgi:hypothetical protein
VNGFKNRQISSTSSSRPACTAPELRLSYIKGTKKFNRTKKRNSRQIVTLLKLAILIAFKEVDYQLTEWDLRLPRKSDSFW